jgi:hypothetical protein
LTVFTVGALSADQALEIPSIPISLNIADQPVVLSVSGSVSGDAQGVALKVRADLTDFQRQMTPVLQAELNQSNRCGERIAVQNATLVPTAPAGLLTVRLHFEKWACIKAFGKENAKRLVGGDGVVEVKLTPRVDEGNTVRLDAEVGKIDADGSLGEMLRSGSLGNALRDKIREALLKAMQKNSLLEAVVPEQVRQYAAIQSVAFADAGAGRLELDVAGRLAVPGVEVSALLEQFRGRR